MDAGGNRDGDKTRLSSRRRVGGAAKVAKTAREKLRELCECDEVVADQEVLAHGRIIREALEPNDDDDDASSNDEVDEILEAERRRLNDALDLPVDTYSLTRINPRLPTRMRYGVRSGLTHRDMPKFSPLSRGLQGSAVAIAAYATTALSKARCWTEMTIDRIVDDGDAYYCDSYERLRTDDRAALTVLDLKRDLVVQGTHRVSLEIDDPAYAGTFRSDTPTELHIAKALELFFRRYDAGVLTSSRLNIAVWRESRHLNIFDGQPRLENLIPVKHEDGATGVGGTAKLIVVRDLTGLLYVILERSDVHNEHFVLYGLQIRAAEPLPAIEDDPEEPFRTIGRAARRPSGYRIQDKFRAVVRGSYHLTHSTLPSELRGRGHLVVAVAAVVYSRLVSANKWTSAIVDLILNQANIYLVDLARVHDKKLDDAAFELTIDDVVADVILGVYSAKVNVLVNVVPGQGKKGKATIDAGLREFFALHDSGILEIKKTFYAIWRDGPKYYMLDPFGCDDEGFRVDLDDPENAAERLGNAAAAVTMNSSIDELIETILENTGNKEKDPFVVHGLKVMYVKTGTTANGSLDAVVVYRDKNANRRPEAPAPPKPEPVDECKLKVEAVPTPRPDAERTKEAFSQYPEPMTRVDLYAMRDDEPTSFVESETFASAYDDTKGSPGDPSLRVKDVRTIEVKGNQDETPDEISPDEQQQVKFIRGYKVVNPRRLILHGSTNCLDDAFAKASQGHQGLALALTAMAYAKIKDPRGWRNLDVDQILRVGDAAYADVVTWIRQGSPDETAEDNAEDAEEEEDEEEEEDNEDRVKKDDEGDATGSKVFRGTLKPAPSHIDVSMLPGRMKLGDNAVTYKKRPRVAEGDADPLANLGEALDSYFARYRQVILENRRLMYGIWRHDDKYFVFNPYGADDEGWRLRDFPAAVVVAETINELTDSLHGILEFNDRTFALHYVGIEAVEPGDKTAAAFDLDAPNDDEVTLGIYRTKFLPVTDDDIPVAQPQGDAEDAGTTVEEPGDKVKVKDDDEDEEEDEGDEDDEEKEEGETDGPDEEVKVSAEEPEVEKPPEDPLLEVDEQERPDAPERLNLSLLTGAVKIVETPDGPDEETLEAVAYERLKYQHPPPYVLPPRRVLCRLLEAKRASRSMHSLISRFSVDSKLAVKATELVTTTDETSGAATVSTTKAEEDKPVRMIKLPPSKYLFSRIPPEGFTPLRAIDETFIRDEVTDSAAEVECRRLRDAAIEETCRDVIHHEDPGSMRGAPTIIPLGPVVRTLAPKRKVKSCGEPSAKRRKSGLSGTWVTGDRKLEKIMCSTEDILLDMIFPGRSTNVVVRDNDGDVRENVKVNDVDLQDNRDNGDYDDVDDDDSEAVPVAVDSVGGTNVGVEEVNPGENADPEPVGFFATDDDNVGIIQANSRLENHATIEDRHVKTCFYAAVLCILTKVTTDVSTFRGTTLDRLILASEKIARRVGKLRHKPRRRFRNVAINGATCDALVCQRVYADPENHDDDDLGTTLARYLTANRTGILSLGNAAYAFWLSDDDRCYLFDPYSCDDQGHRSDDTGHACLLQFCDLDAAIARIRTNDPGTTTSPYRIYSLSIAHMETTRKNRKYRRRREERCSIDESDGSVIPEDEPAETHQEHAEKNITAPEPRRELSLVELPEWATTDPEDRYRDDVDHPDANVIGFVAMRNFNASALKVTVLENDVTRPCLTPFRRLKVNKSRRSDIPATPIPIEPKRRKIYDRKFTPRNSLAPALDLCIIAWSGIRDPVTWGVRTIRAIFEAARELAFDSLLAAHDSGASRYLTDRVLDEFTVGNYSFRAVHAPLHRGALYAPEGWNLAMSLKRLFDVPIYSGAYVTCADAHVGVTRRGDVYYAWWTIRGTKNLRVVAAESFEDFLRLIIGAINVTDETAFEMRVVTISWARKLDPDCSDVEGLHEPPPTSSLPQIHRRNDAPYDVVAIFRPTRPAPADRAIFVIGKVGLRDRDVIREPLVKRCYFVAVLATIVKRDVVQSPVPGMIDRVIEIGDRLYEEFYNERQPVKFHTEHVLRNFPVMSRVFDVRDCAGTLYTLTGSPSDFYTSVRRQLRRHLDRHTDGVIQFTNCCYGFWYSRANDAYYYVDPYPCDSRGRRVDVLQHGGGCLGVFPSICQMARHMCVNRCVDTTGFIIHRIHVETIDAPAHRDENFREDPMWVYLDYHWSFAHSQNVDDAPARRGRKISTKKRDDFRSVVGACDGPETTGRTSAKPTWNNYTVEIDNLVYSAWGTVGCYDRRFGARAGENRAAVCVATLAMQFLCRPARWSAAILDSGVICGDAYYTESLRSAAARRSTAGNRFDLQTTLKVSPHVWTIGYHVTKCGILYGIRDDRPCLAVTLRTALDETENVVVECGAVTLGIVACDDGYYVVDPCWTGPPLFSRNRGAAYALRCRNYDVLVYVTTKIFNTNLRLEFKVTPVTFEFGREVCGPAATAASRRRTLGGKMILMDAAGARPGSADGPDVPVPGALTVPDEDDYSAYRRSVAAGLARRPREERAMIDDRSGRLFTDDGLMDNLISRSTAWHLNVGQSPRKRAALLTTVRAGDPCRGFSCGAIEPRRSRDITEKIQMCDEYPRTIDLLVGRNVPVSTTKILTRRKAKIDVVPSQPMDCLPGRKFVLDSSRREFERRNRDMADEAYKNYKHRRPGNDDDLNRASGEDEQPTGDHEVVAPVESETGDNVDE